MDKKLKVFRYVKKENYDDSVKINHQEVGVYSKSKFDEIYKDKEPKFAGEVLENKKLKDEDLGKIELADKILYVKPNDTFSRFFKKEVGYIDTQKDGLITVLKRRVLIILLIGALILGLLGAGGYYVYKNYIYKPVEPIEPIEDDYVSITGYVNKGEEKLAGAVLKLYIGDELLDTFTTEADGKYLFAKVSNSTYSIICIYGDSQLITSVRVDNETVEYDFDFPNIEDGSVNAIVKKTNEYTPTIAVKGLDKEVYPMAESNKDIVLTLLATKLQDEELEEEEEKLFVAKSGELEMSYFDFSVLKELFKDTVLEDSKYLSETSNVLEIAVAYDTSKSVATYVFRNHDGEIEKFEELESRPTSNYKDGTYYVTRSAVYIYTNQFSTYAIGAANSEEVVKGEDTFTYSNVVYVSKTDKTIEVLYKRDSSSTNTSKVQVYLKGEEKDYLIGESTVVPAGYKLEKINLSVDAGTLPSVGSYEGYMKIIYLDANGEEALTNANVEVTVVVKQ